MLSSHLKSHLRDFLQLHLEMATWLDGSLVRQIMPILTQDFYSVKVNKLTQTRFNFVCTAWIWHVVFLNRGYRHLNVQIKYLTHVPQTYCGTYQKYQSNCWIMFNFKGQVHTSSDCSGILNAIWIWSLVSKHLIMHYIENPVY